MAQPGFDRDQGIDALRGLAIAAMLASHLAWASLDPDPPVLLRMFSSLAAPLFVTLAGLLVAQTTARKHYPLKHYLVRGAIIALIGGCLDVALWGLYPFVGVDVLYLIGLALPLTAVFCRLAPAWQVGLLIALLGASEPLRLWLGYPNRVLAFSLAHGPGEVVRHAPVILRQWVVSGWFPAFPWLFFPFLGSLVFQGQQQGADVFRRQARILAVCLAGLGLLFGLVFPPPWSLRGGYCELFYPPTTTFVLGASAAVLLLFSFAGSAWLKANRPLILMGQCSLLLYLTHLMLLHWVVEPLFPEVQLPTYLLLFAALLALLVGIAEVVHLVKRRASHRLPFPLRFLLGG